MSESIHEKLERVRKPRVHIKYEVETEGAKVVIDLPFIVGVMGDFSGNNPTKQIKSLAEREFIQIDRDNFNAVMEKMTPGLKFKVENTLAGNNKEMDVELTFKSMEDFEPANIVKQIDSLKKLKETRDKLSELMTKADVSVALEGILEKVLEKTEEGSKLIQLAGELGIDTDQGQDKPEEENKP